jgi:hypothetical protein
MPPQVTPMAYCKCVLLCDSLQRFTTIREGEVMYNTGLNCFHSYVEPFAKFYSQTSRKVILVSERAYTR